MGEQRALYDWFAASAAAYPDHPALEVGSSTLTYAELAALADRLAAELLRLLEDRGSGQGRTAPHRIGLLVSRTVVAYAGYLAVQRLGATAVPLGPSFPAERNATVVRKAAVDAVLCDGGPGTDQELPAPVLRVVAADLPYAAAPTALPLPAHRPRPEDLAYILFTSGSTGAPKGVPIRHRNVNAYLAHVVPCHGTGPGARLSQTFDLTFDPSVLDLFAAWGTGATLVVPTRGELLSPVRFVNRRRITHWNSVPSVISIADRLRALKPGSMPTLRRSTFCGEPLTLRQAEAWQRAAPGSTVENSYGPTELTVTCTTHRLPRDPDLWPRPASGTVPIGTPYPGVETLLRDGELSVRGPQRFPGYLDPADNAGRFLAPDGTPYDPATPLTDAHWYRTGDRVEPLRAPGGALVHLGRLDDQVQVHGYRVELGEVEAALRAQPGITEAVVLATATPDGGTELSAAYTADPAVHPEPPHPEPLRKALGTRLPPYMIPAALTPLDALPLTANGKIDRRAVARKVGSSAADEFAAPDRSTR
ncbi:AMP-binding protein [Streptomyces pathocidini]|uniref:AMP-binding protein n=2 Tax=Streptomyces pathocidini TaxID=1650571 RepID=A0ABW7V0L8_9ACTN